LTLTLGEPAHSSCRAGPAASWPGRDLSGALQPAVESLEAWKQEQGIEDERLTLKPEDLGLRITYLATGPVTGTSVPDCDFAVPFA
jgi:hypothetical protein